MVQADQDDMDSLHEENLDISLSSIEKTNKSVVDILTGPQKAAVLLISLKKETASRFIKKFDTNDLRNLNEQIRTIPEIKVDDLEKIVKNFENDFAKGDILAVEQFSSLVQESFAETDNTASVIFNFQEAESEKVTTENAVEILSKMSADELSSLLVAEHPQVISYIFSRLPAKLAAEILLILPIEVRIETIHRALHLKEVLPTVEAAFNQTLTTILAKRNNEKKVVHYKKISTVLNQLEKKELNEVLLNLQKLQTEDITAIKSGLFAFEDIACLTDKARITLFNEVPYDILIKALHDVNHELKEMILSSLPQRTRRMVESEIAIPNDQLVQTDILQARRKIANIVLSMIEKQLINLS